MHSTRWWRNCVCGKLDVDAPPLCLMSRNRCCSAAPSVWFALLLSHFPRRSFVCPWFSPDLLKKRATGKSRLRQLKSLVILIQKHTTLDSPFFSRELLYLPFLFYCLLPHFWQVREKWTLNQEEGNSPVSIDAWKKAFAENTKSRGKQCTQRERWKTHFFHQRSLWLVCHCDERVLYYILTCSRAATCTAPLHNLKRERLLSLRPAAFVSWVNINLPRGSCAPDSQQ